MAEELNFDSLWIGDHLASKNFKLESWTTITALSTVTSRIRLGHLALCNSFRHPPLLAKMASTLDNISKGRFEFGIGSGWDKDEHIAYGYDFPKAKIRNEKLDESLSIIKKLWSEDEVDFFGKHFELRKTVCEPKPIQKPYPPITVAGGGEKYTLKIAALHGNRCNPGGSVEVYKKKLDVLREHCKNINRNYDEISKIFFSYTTGIFKNKEELNKQIAKRYMSSVHKNHMTYKEFSEIAKSGSIMGTKEECSKKIQEYANIGVDYFIFSLIDPFKDKESMDFFANINPR